MSETTQPLIVVRYQRLMEIARDLASTLDLEVLLDRIVHAATELCLAEAGSILLYDENQRELYFQAATNMEAPMRGIKVPLEGSIAGWIVRHAKPVIYNDISEAREYYRQVSQVTNLETASLMGVPLISQDCVIGVLEVINKVFGKFTGQDLDLLMALGAQPVSSWSQAQDEAALLPVTSAPEGDLPIMEYLPAAAAGEAYAPALHSGGKKDPDESSRAQPLPRGHDCLRQPRAHLSSALLPPQPGEPDDPVVRAAV